MKAKDFAINGHFAIYEEIPKIKKQPDMLNTKNPIGPENSHCGIDIFCPPRTPIHNSKNEANIKVGLL